MSAYTFRKMLAQECVMHSAVTILAFWGISVSIKSNLFPDALPFLSYVIYETPNQRYLQYRFCCVIIKL
jgi:hypothetical protein